MNGAAYLDSSRHEFRRLQTLADGALAQVTDPQFFATLDPESNSLAILVKHVGGNLRSRWVDFLTTDGEKPDRRRDLEFVLGPEDTRATLTESWTAGWNALHAAIDPLQPDDLERLVTIRGEPHTVLAAIQRQVAHYGYHVGQIVFLAKHWAGADWTSLSIPRGASDGFNARMADRFPGEGPPR